MDNESLSPSSPTSPDRFQPVPQVFALVVGINNYANEDYPNLSAAARDADTFEEFLRENLHVSQSNITSLRNENATRRAIIDGFEALRDNVKIKKDEAAIIIYFAGHGARGNKPVEWEDWITTGDQIEMMCPHDIGVVIKNKDGVEVETPGIHDRTVSVLLNHISDVKGDNITLILDCCSSAGINRSGNHNEPFELGYTARRIPNPPQILPDCDRRLWSRGTRNAGIAQGFAGKFHASHVLLAACGRDQSAWEDPKTGQGMFTQRILKVMKEQEIEGLTYTSLMHRLNMPPWQTPHCEGQNVSRRLFNNRAVGADDSFIVGSRDRESGTIVLQAGASQGITLGSKFSVHHSNLANNPSRPNAQVGVVVVTSVDAFSSTLSIPKESKRFSLPRIAYCKLIERGSESIALYCNDQTWLQTVLFPPAVQKEFSVTFASTLSAADLELTLIDESVHFDRHDKLVTPHIGTRLPHSIDVKNIYKLREVVRCTVHFYHHLTRAGDDEFRNVWMELKVLKVELSEDFDQTSLPVGENLIEHEPATVVIDESARLGMTIFNQTDLPLYPFLFYFDPSDLMIIEWYTPPFGAGAGKVHAAVDVPLPAKSQLTIGYGSGGVAPWQFLLREGESKDVGFFKLFLTTSPTSFSNIIQDSPFESSISRHGGPAAPKQPDAQSWAAKLSTVIQVDKLPAKADH